MGENKAKTETAADDCDPEAASAALAPGLYVVATPIGHMGDITRRALDTLTGVDAIACEDSRVTGKLLRRYGIDRPMIPYHDHNAATVRPDLLARLADGARIALVSDAGTPLIADPGYKLVTEAAARAIAIHPIPGASALLAALTVAGLPTDRFLFAGFPPQKKQKRLRMLSGLTAETGTLVFYESPQRLAETLAAMADTYGPRQACVCRELTKKFEEARRGRLDDLARTYAEQGPPKGEVAIVVAGADPETADEARLDSLLGEALTTLSVKEAAHAVAWVTGLPRRTVYNRALALSDDAPDSGQ